MERLLEIREEMRGARGGGAPFVMLGLGGGVAYCVGGVLGCHFGN